MSSRDGRHAIALLCALLVAGVLSAAPVSAQPAPEIGGSSDWRVVSAGANHTCGIRTTGRLYCWGQDGGGQLGNGAPTDDQATPVPVGSATDWTAVSAGALHTCGIRRPGRLYCWGRDDLGQVGDAASNFQVSSPVAVSPGVTNWTSVSAGFQHTCGRRRSGRLFCWGYDGHGQVGNGNGVQQTILTPTLVVGRPFNWTSVSVNAHTSCGRRANGRLYCWGSDVNGMLGNGGADVERAAPRQVAGGATSWTSVSVGSTHVCARRTNNRAYCWGGDVNGQLGNGAASGNRSTPTLVGGGVTRFTAVTAGGLHSCGRSTIGRILCWGDTGSGQTGVQNDGGSILLPTQIVGHATDWATVDAGGFHTCARTTTKRLYCWGEDSDGAVGNDPDFVDTEFPEEVWPF